MSRYGRSAFQAAKPNKECKTDCPFFVTNEIYLFTEHNAPFDVLYIYLLSGQVLDIL